jgi:prevent-host-death family protein
MREIDAFEAKNKLGQLLDAVGHGEDVMITRYSREVARLNRPIARVSASLADNFAIGRAELLPNDSARLRPTGTPPKDRVRPLSEAGRLCES